MIILDATTKSLEVLLGGAVTTTELAIVASYVDLPAYTPAANDTQSNGATAVTAVSAPGSGVQRQVKFLAIHNDDTVAATVTVRLNNNSTYRALTTIDLPVGATLFYTDGEGFRVILAEGGIATAEIDEWVSQTTTATGTQNDFNVSGRKAYLRCNNASALTLTGFTVDGATPQDGDEIIIECGTANYVDVLDQDTGSTAGNRVICESESGQICGQGGFMKLLYDGASSAWRLHCLSPGAPYVRTFSAGDYFGSGSMTITVDSGDRSVEWFLQRGNIVTMSIWLEGFSVGGTPDSIIYVALPRSWSPAKGAACVGGLIDGSTYNGLFTVVAAAGYLLVIRNDGAALTASTDGTYLYGTIEFEVD